MQTTYFTTTKPKSLYPWLCWFLASCFIFYKYLLQVSPSIMIPELMHTFHLTGASMGNLAAFYFYAYLAMQIPVGILLDRYDPRYLISIAILICAAGAFVFATAINLTVAELGRMLIGIGGAFSAVGTMKLISVWFPSKRFALVSGLMMTMAMLGAIGGEAPLSTMVLHLGWRHTIFVCSFIGVILALLIYFFVRDNPNASKSHLPLSSLLKELKTLLKNKQVWLISIYSGLAFAPISAFAGLWGVPFIANKFALHREFAASIVSVTFIGFAIGSPFAGWLSDKINRRKPIMIFGTSVSLICLAIIIYYNFHSTYVLSCLFLLFGFASGFFFVSFAFIREINQPYLAATAIAFINMFDALLGSLFEPGIGKLLDLGAAHLHRHQRLIQAFNLQDYQHALFALIVSLCLALVIQYFIKETYCVAK